MTRLTLTFDNGPAAGVTPRVLDILAAHGVASTFFTVGRQAAAPGALALLERAHGDGHWIGNHTYSHQVPLGLDRDPAAPEAEIGRTQALIAGLAHERKLFRPFGGGGHLDGRPLSRSAVDYLCTHQFTCVLWNSVAHDWEDEDGWPERALADLAGRDWTLLVVHDIPKASAKGLDRFLRDVVRQGVDIVQDFPPDCVPIERGRLIRPEHLPAPGLD